MASRGAGCGYLSAGRPVRLAFVLAVFGCLLSGGVGDGPPPSDLSASAVAHRSLPVSAEPPNAPSPTPFVAKMPPYSLACGALLLSPLTDKCGYESGDLLNMLLEQHEEVYIIPKEACGVSCIDAVLGIIRSNSACTQLQEWLPDETADLKPLLGKRYSRACADIWASKRAEEGSEAEKRACTVAWEACEFSLPQSSMQLTPTKVKSNLENDIYNNWSCPNSCNSTYLGQLTSQACASHLLTLSLGNSSSTGKHLLAEAIRAALLDKDKGVRRICELTVDPRDTEMVAVRFIARGLEASALPADERLREAYLRNAIANASGVLPRYVTVGTEADGRVLSLKLKGEVLLPAEQRLKLAVLDGRLMQNLASIFPEDRASAIAANAWLEELQIQPIRGWAEGEVIEVFFNSHSSASVGGALRTLALSAAVYLFAVGHGGGGL